MPLDDRTRSAFDAASETVKQLLALATASIGGLVALFDDATQAGISFGKATLWVNSALGLFGLSTVFGLLALGALAGQLGADRIAAPSTYAPAVRATTIIQMAGYGLGVVAAVLAAVT